MVRNKDKEKLFIQIKRSIRVSSKIINQTDSANLEEENTSMKETGKMGRCMGQAQVYGMTGATK